MTGVPLEHCLGLAVILFALGLFGVLTRRNFIFMLLSVEIMLNAAAFAMIAVANYLGEADGQVMFVMILTVAAAEVAIGLAIAFRYEEQFNTLDVNAASQMKG